MRQTSGLRPWIAHQHSANPSTPHGISALAAKFLQPRRLASPRLVASTLFFLCLCLLPDSARGAPSDKSLIKLESNPTVYWLQNNTIYPIVSADVIDTMHAAGLPGWDWSSITSVSSLPYATGPNFITADGTSHRLLIKLSNNNAVYQVNYDSKEFLSSELFDQRDYSFDDVISVPQTYLDMFATQDFTVSVSPSGASTNQGGAALYAVTVKSSNRFGNAVTLDVLDLPGDRVVWGTGFDPKQVAPQPNGSTSSTLAVATDNETPVGTFTITIRGTSYGLVRSTTASLTVNQKPAPTITSISPASAQASDVTLTIEGSNFDAGTIDQIYFGSTLVGSGDIQLRSTERIVVVEHMSSATPGTYTVKVKNSAGQLSDGVSWTITCGPPAITAQPVDQTINSGQQAGLVVAATGTAPLNYQWYIGASGDTSNPIGGATSASLTTAQLTSTTNYWVRVVNDCGSVDSRTVKVNVGTGPSISSISPSTVMVNQQTVLTVNGTNFQNGFAASVTGPDGTFNIASTGLSFVSSNQVQVQVTMGSTPPYSATLQITNPDTQSATKTFQVASAPDTNPAFNVSPGSGPLGTVYTHDGTKFTPNSTATIFILQGDGSVIGPYKYNTDSSGSFSFRYTSKAGDPLGTYIYDVSDDSTGQLAKAQVQYVEGPPPAVDVLDRNTYPIDRTINDWSEFSPGETQQKIWKIRNGGTNAWTNYRLVFLSGTVNGHPSTNLSDRTSVTINAAPGETFYTPPIPITAPQGVGVYYSYWGMENAQGQRFGGPIWVIINVVKAKTAGAGLGGQNTGRQSGDSPSSRSGYGGDPVNTATGNFNYEQTDLHVPGRRMDFDFSRSYNSQDTRRGPLGNGWTHSFNIYLDHISDASATINYSDGKAIEYDKDPDTGIFRARYPGFYEILVRNADNTWTLQKTNQRTYRFSAPGKLISISDPNQNQLSFNYDGNGNLSEVIDTAGRAYTFTYSGALLTALTDTAGRKLEFTYDANSNLISFRNANGSINSYRYDDNSRLTSIIDGRGNTFLSNTYDAGGKVVSQTNGRGNTYKLSYDFERGLTTITDPNLNNTVHLHDENFNLQTTTNSLGLSNVVLYDERGNRKQVSDAKGNYYSFSYGNNGNIETVTNPLQNSRQITYDIRNNPLSLTNELGKKTEMAYDARGNLVKVTDPLGKVSTTTYNSFGQPLVVTEANGSATTHAYDAQGNLVSVKDALGNKTTYTYDAVGRRTGMTDARGEATAYTYDANNNLLTITDPSGGVTTHTYDANNNRASTRDARGNTTRYEYDKNNLLVKETDSAGNFVQHTYDKLDRRIATRDRRGHITTFGYDGEGRLISLKDPLGHASTYKYDANGNRTEVRDAKGQSTVFTYDAMNRITKIQDPLGNTINREYDAAGRLKREIDPRGNAPRFTYDDVGNLTLVVDAAGGSARYTYDNNRNRISQTDPKGKTSLLGYDKLSRLASSTDPLGNTFKYTYDEAGNRSSQTDAKGQTIRFTYDASGRLTVITYPNSSTVRFTYDANGNVLSMVDALGTTRYVYDQLNRLTTYTDAFGKTIGYQYDPNGNVTVLTYPDGKQVTYQYDAADRLAAVTDWANRTTSYQYDSANLVTKVIYPNGTTTSYTYDKVGRLTGKADDPAISAYTFVLDASGNRAGASIKQPLSAEMVNLSQSSTYDSANRIKTAGAASFTFDPNGNMTGKTANGVTTAYAYDFQDRLTAVGNSARYFYNGAGIRLKKIESSKTTRYVVDVNRDLSQVLCETDATGNITAYYVYGLGLISKVGTDGKHFYYHFDATGSTIAMTDDAKSIVNAYAYDPFGKVTGKFENTPNTFKFVGQYGVEQDSNGLLFMRARYYMPELGRFLNKDLVPASPSSPQSLNPFIYVNNNPIDAADPSGLIFEYDGWLYRHTNFADNQIAVDTANSYLCVIGRINRSCEALNANERDIAISKDLASLSATPFAPLKIYMGIADTIDLAKKYIDNARGIRPISEEEASADFFGLGLDQWGLPSDYVKYILRKYILSQPNSTGVATKPH